MQQSLRLSPRLRFDLVVNNFVGWAVATYQIEMVSDGTPWRPNVHVRDVCAAFIAVLNTPIEVIHDETFNVGMDSENYSIRKIAEIVTSAIPGTQLKCLNQTPTDPRSYNVSFEKIRNSLPSFKPKWTVSKGVREMFNVLNETEFSAEDFQSKRFNRLKQLKYLMETGQIDSDLYWTN